MDVLKPKNIFEGNFSKHNNRDHMAGTGDGSDLSSRPSGDQGRRARHTVLEEKHVDDYSIEKVIECYRFEMCALTNTRKGRGVYESII